MRNSRRRMEGGATPRARGGAVLIGLLALAATSPLEAQVRLAADIAGSSLTPASSTTTDPIAVAGVAIAQIDDGATGSEPWVTDGFELRQLRDVNPGQKGSSPQVLAVSGRRVLLSANDTCAGQEPWVSDGTAEGTRRLADLNPGPAHSNPGAAVALAGGRWLFLARGASDTWVLWLTDGENLVVPAEVSGVVGGTPTPIGELGDQALLRSGVPPTLWITDGTASGTRPVATWPTANSLTYLGQVQGRAVLMTIEPSGPRAWTTDGTAAGTVPLFTGDDTQPRWHPLGTMADGFWMAGDFRGSGWAAWTTDGTPEGTSLRSLPGGVTGLRGALQREGHVLATGQSGTWRLDGDEATLLSSARCLTDSCRLADLGAVAVFSASTDADGRELWRSDGTPAGTRVIRDLTPQMNSGGSAPTEFTPLGAGVLFTALPDTSSLGLYMIEEPGDWRLLGTYSHVSYSALTSELTRVEDRVFFSAQTGGGSRHPWVTDGTVAGTLRLAGPNGLQSVGNAGYAGVGRHACFSALGVEGWEPWCSDGTIEGTRLLADIAPGAASSNPAAWTSTGSLAFFVATDGEAGQELWVTDGSSAGTRMVADIKAGPESSMPQALSSLGERVVFFADDGVHDYELWGSDGTSQGTMLLADIVPSGPAHFSLLKWGVASGRFYFVSRGVTPPGLWASDGTPEGTRRLADMVLDGREVNANHYTSFGRGCAFLGALRGAEGQLAVYVTDGTAEGTRVVLGPRSGLSKLWSVDDHLIVSIETSDHMFELLILDSAGRARSILGGPRGSTPASVDHVVASGDWIYFTATDAHAGSEPHALPRAYFADSDLDGVADEHDGCPFAADPLQEDFDRDGAGDACDPCRFLPDVAVMPPPCGPAASSCGFAWGDIAPAGAPDGRLDIADVVRMLRMTVGLETPDAGEALRASLSPSQITSLGSLPVHAPTAAPPNEIRVDDVVLALRASVGLIRLSLP